MRQRVVTYQSPNGATASLCRDHRHVTLRDSRGVELCSVHIGEHSIAYDDEPPCVVCAEEYWQRTPHAVNPENNQRERAAS